MSADEYTPTWHAGMYGCREDMFSRSALEKIVAEVARAAKAEALEEAAEHMEASADIADDGYVANWFRAKANELRKVATDE